VPEQERLGDPGGRRDLLDPCREPTPFTEDPNGGVEQLDSPVNRAVRSHTSQAIDLREPVTIDSTRLDTAARAVQCAANQAFI